MFSLEFRVILLRLHAIRPPAFTFLVPTHTCAQSNVYSRRRRESKALRDFHKIELVHIKDRTQRMGGVCLKVRSIAIFCRLGSLLARENISRRKCSYLVEVVVLSDQFLQLTLYVDDLLAWEFELDYRHFGFFQLN